MGDIIKLEKITLLYGHLYQIDYYNETKDYHGRLFVEKAQVESAEIEDDTILDKNCMCDEKFYTETRLQEAEKELAEERKDEQT